jgi:hypothetical protein
MAGRQMRFSQQDVPHLSCRCWKCGDSTSMPPRSEPSLVLKGFEGSKYAGPHGEHARRQLYAVLHTCTNDTCYGATIGYYSSTSERLVFEFHTPQHGSYKASEEIPQRPRTMLQDAHDSRRSPVACVSAAVRAVEAMLAEKGYNNRKGGLIGRIKQAVADGRLPGVMQAWALDVREIGTDTHTDEAPAPLPDEREAERALSYAIQLANYLFVMPAQIEKQRARRKSGAGSKDKGN